MKRRAAAALLVLLAGCRGAEQRSGIPGVQVNRPQPVVTADSFSFREFGTVRAWRPPGVPAAVVLLFSDSSGPTDSALARRLAGGGALVLGADTPHYLLELGRTPGCAYPAADLESLSQYAQQRYAAARYDQPLLAGRGIGAALAYAAAAQAPPNTFAAAFGLGHPPALPLSHAPCAGTGLVARPLAHGGGYQLSARHMATLWQVAPDDSALVAAVVRVIRTRTPSAGGGLKGLPLVDVAAHGTSPYAAVMISGDGGWAGIDRSVSQALAAQGVPVAGLNALQYFWRKRTPESATADLVRIARHQLARWPHRQLILAGYSFGADVLPFMVNRLPDDLRARVALVALISPTPTADFEFHVTDWLPGRHSGRPTAPEIARLAPLPVLCIAGSDERDAICARLPAGSATPIILPGGHHYGGDYGPIARRILRAARSAPDSGAPVSAVTSPGGRGR